VVACNEGGLKQTSVFGAVIAVVAAIIVSFAIVKIRRR
jgi:hypothetical protein